VPQKSTFIIIIYKETDLHWQWPMQVCYLETIFTAPVIINKFIGIIYINSTAYNLADT